MKVSKLTKIIGGVGASMLGVYAFTQAFGFQLDRPAWYSEVLTVQKDLDQVAAMTLEQAIRAQQSRLWFLESQRTRFVKLSQKIPYDLRNEIDFLRRRISELKTRQQKRRQ